MRLISSQHNDLRKVSKCHVQAFPNALSTALGKEYVSQMLSWYLSTNKSFLFHLEDDSGNCVGYCGAIVNDGTLNTGSASGMAQHTFNAAIKTMNINKGYE